MSVLVLRDGRRALGVRGDALAVMVNGDVVLTRHTDTVDEVHCYGQCRVSPSARTLCLTKGIDVVFFSPTGLYRGRLSSVSSRAGDRRLAQLARVLDPEARLGVARTIVQGKIRNQLVLLGRVQRRERREAVAEALTGMTAALPRLDNADLDQVRGIEGYAAKLYFGALRHGSTNPLFSFSGRNRRPPKDALNAMLSFVYTLLCLRTHAAARGAGLDAHVGFLHEASRGQPACGLDLAEEWRPVVDALVFGLVNRRELAPEDFRPVRIVNRQGVGEDGVYLDEVGRDIVFRAWMSRVSQAVLYPPSGGHLEIGDVLVAQAQALARVCEGRQDEYQPWRWR